MRSVRLKAFLFSALLFLTSLPGSFAAEEPWTDQFFREFTQIKGRLTELEKAQDALVQREDQALKEIDQIRKWVARRPGAPHP